MSMEHLCLIFCCICVNALLRLATPEEIVALSHTPPKLHLRWGKNATFTCHFTALDFIPQDINWYKQENGKQQKIADMSSRDKNEKLRIMPNWSQKTAVLHIKNLEPSDSGKYRCGHVNITNSSIVFVSNMSELTVENLQYMTTTRMASTLIKGSLDVTKKASRETATIATSIVIVLLLLLSVGIVIIIARLKQRNETPQLQVRPSEKPHQDPEIYTVDYGVLDFGSRTPSRKSADVSVLEQVEYAAIMFSQGTPRLGEQRINAT